MTGVRLRLATWGLSALLLATVATPSIAAPGLGSKVYGARVEAGVTEIEARYGELSGGSADGEAGLVVEVAHGFNDRFYGALLGEFEREPGHDAFLDAAAVEGVYAVGQIPGLGVDVAVYGEYEATLKNEADKIELKALFQKTAGPFDGRLNLIAGRSLASRSVTGFGYAASADWEVIHDVRLGLEAFGDLGDSDHPGGRQAHFIGPVVEFELDELPLPGELEIRAGYLFPAGAARDETDGQARLSLEWEAKF